MPQGLSFIGWLLERLIFYWLAPPSKLIFIGWLLPRTGLPRWKWGVVVGGGGDSSISSVGKTHMSVSTYGGQTALTVCLLCS